MTELPAGFVSLEEPDLGAFLLCCTCWCPVARSKTAEHMVIHPSALDPGDAPVVLDVATRRCWAGGLPVALTTREFELLAFLGENSGRIVHRREITRALWRADDISARQNLTVVLFRVRKALGYPHQDLIKTARNLGYIVEEGMIALTGGKK